MSEPPDESPEAPENTPNPPEKPSDSAEKSPESETAPPNDENKLPTDGDKPPDKPADGDKPPSKPDKPTDPDKPPKPASSETIFDILADKWNSIYQNPYRMRIIMCAVLFLFALEVARELKNIALPLRLYKPFRKVGECFKCLFQALCG